MKKMALKLITISLIFGVLQNFIYVISPQKMEALNGSSIIGIIVGLVITFAIFLYTRSLDKKGLLQ